MSTTDCPEPCVSTLLADHHARLDRVCTALLAETYSDDPRALCACWRRFADEVEAHMRAEEAAILPLYETAAPAEAKAVRDDHARMRDVLRRLDVEVDLHQVRAATVRAMITALREHAAREDRGMYPWAQEHLPRPRLGALRERFEALLRVA